MLSALFLSHGAPTFPLTDAPAKSCLECLSRMLAHRPEAILVVSAALGNGCSDAQRD